MKTKQGEFLLFKYGGWVVAGLAAAILSGCTSPGNLAQQQASLPREQVDAHGLYVENCARCHGEDGRAKTMRGKMMGAQDFTEAEFKSKASNDDIVRVIKMGHKKMPSFEDKLSGPEIEALAAYVKTFSPP